MHAETDLLSPEEIAAQILAGRVTPRTVRLWCSSGQLPALHAGRKWLVRRADIMAFLQPTKGVQTESNSLAA